MMSDWISQNFRDKKHLGKAAPDYSIFLKNSGFNDNITCIPSQSKRHSRKRKIIWFNPQYSTNIKTDGGNIFMRLGPKMFS